MTMLLLAVLACRGEGTNKPYDHDTGLETIRPDTGDPVDTGCPGPTDVDADGWDGASSGGGDCDDVDPAIHPTAVDTADGVDDDCDGVDGVPASCVPSGIEQCDGDDDDCDGRVDDAVVVDLVLSATVCLVAPVLGTGSALVVGRTGGVDGSVNVYDMDGALVVQIVGTDQSPSFGQQLASGQDLTGDGVDDLVIAAPNAVVDGVANKGRVFVIPGPITSDTSLADAVAVFIGGELPGQPGGTLALLPDLTGDGEPELVISYYRHLLIFSGLPPAEARLADASATLELNTGGGAWNVTTAPDVDGDGRPELVVGLSTYGTTGLAARWNSQRLTGVIGAADLVWDAGSYTEMGGSLARVGDEVWALAGGVPVRLGAAGVDEALDLVSAGLADGGDLDGDGVNELLIATESGVVAWSNGEVGRWPGEVVLQTQRSVEAPEDVNGDGLPDPAVLGATEVTVLDGALAFGGVCDFDGDGVTAYAGDCDDEDATQAPLYGLEECDGIDNDCDGFVDAPSLTELVDRPNHATAVGDLDGDGDDELAILDGEGLIHVLDGGGNERGRITGGDPLVAYPFAGLGDVDEDGFPEIIATNGGSAWILPAGLSAGAVEADAEVRIEGRGDVALDGRVGSAGDHDGDGVPDVWLVTTTFGGAYSLVLYKGPVVTGDVDDADVTLESPPSWDTIEVAGARPGASADLDGDGRDDLLVGNPRSAYGAGRVFVFLEQEPGSHAMDRVASLLLYGDPGEAMGGAVAIGGDLDGDGRSDALVAGALAVRVIGGAACPAVLPERYEVGAEGVAIADVDGDGVAEAWMSDEDGDEGRGILWRASWGESPERTRVGQAGDALGSALWNVGDTVGSGGSDILWRTSAGGARLGGVCP